LRLKGVNGLDRRGLAVLRELHAAREAWAREFGRPPFRLVGNDAMLAVARERPESVDALLGIPGCTARVVGRLGERMLSAVRRGMAVADAELPVRARRECPSIPPAVRRRVDALTAWRAGAAGRWGLDPGVLLPRRLIERAAAIAPPDLEALAQIDGMKRWRVAALGPELLAVLAGCGGAPAPGCGGGAP
jgi:ribonuclease D